MRCFNTYTFLFEQTSVSTHGTILNLLNRDALTILTSLRSTVVWSVEMTHTFGNEWMRCGGVEVQQKLSKA